MKLTIDNRVLTISHDIDGNVFFDEGNNNYFLTISKDDEFKETFNCQKYNIKNTKIFMPYILANSTYDFSENQNLEWFEIGKSQAIEKLKTL